MEDGGLTPMARATDTKRTRTSLGSAAPHTMIARTQAIGATTDPMATIVEYTNQKPPSNQYPQRIVSPARSGPCCFTDMEDVGTPQENGHWVFQYKRCRTCGFALRVILRELPDVALIADLRKILATAFVRNVPE